MHVVPRRLAEKVYVENSGKAWDGEGSLGHAGSGSFPLRSAPWGVRSQQAEGRRSLLGGLAEFSGVAPRVGGGQEEEVRAEFPCRKDSGLTWALHRLPWQPAVVRKTE